MGLLTSYRKGFRMKNHPVSSLCPVCGVDNACDGDEPCTAFKCVCGAFLSNERNEVRQYLAHGLSAFEGMDFAQAIMQIETVTAGETLEQMQARIYGTPLSVFARRVLATLCQFEAMSAAEDKEMLDGMEFAQFHAVEVRADDPDLPAMGADFITPTTRHFVIVDQYNNAAGRVLMYDQYATFTYSIITG